MLEVMGIIFIILLAIGLASWIIWVSVGVVLAWGNDTDITLLKMDGRQSRSWGNEVSRRLNVIEKKLKIKEEK